MKIISSGGAYVAQCSFAEKDTVKAAGFRWNPDGRCWWTKDRAVASRLVEFASPEVKDDLERSVLSLELSRKTEGTIDYPKPDGLEYLPFQKAGIEYMLGRKRTLLADQMGLGKTIQSIGVINSLPEIKSVLIICPASLKLNWARELEKWLVRPMIIGIADTKNVPAADVIITNYDILTKIGMLEKVSVEERGKMKTKYNPLRRFDLVICDEAHYARNRTAMRTQAVAGLVKAGNRVILATGTPVVNRPSELWQILTMVDPEAFGPGQWWWYHKRYCNMQQTRYGWEVGGANIMALPELQDRLRRSVMIRRLKEEVLKELPPKRRQLIVLEANGDLGLAVRSEKSLAEQREAQIDDAEAEVELAKAGDGYDDAVRTLTEVKSTAFAEMSKVRQATAVIKAPYVVDYIKDMLEQVGKVVVFAHHKEVVRVLMEGLSEFNPVSITGDTSMPDRQKAVDYFQTNNTVRVFVGSITAAGVGLTLTAASTVVFAELDWVPGNVSQAEDRCHRIGQGDAVSVYHIVIDGSIDQRLAKTIIDKQAVIDAATNTLYTGKVVEPKERPATRSVTKEEVEEKAKAVKPEDAAIVLRGLQVLAGSDLDYARQKNDIGFSKIDAKIGHSLSEREYLTPKQAVLGARLCRKYRRQLGVDIVEAAERILK